MNTLVSLFSKNYLQHSYSKRENICFFSIFVFCVHTRVPLTYSYQQNIMKHIRQYPEYFIIIVADIIVPYFYDKFITCHTNFQSTIPE